MDRLGIQSLNAGAPDLRLSGDQTQRGTYTQRRRDQMAYGGIAGLDGRKRYWIGSAFQKWIKDPIEMLITGKTPAQLEAESQARVDREDAMFGEGYENPIDTFFKGTKTGEIDEKTGEAIRENALFGIPSAIGKAVGLGEDQWGKYTIPMLAGKLAHDYQEDWLAKQPKFPADETKIDFKTAQEYMDDPTQRFKPKAAYADLAEGGRIGYNRGRVVNPGGYAGEMNLKDEMIKSDPELLLRLRELFEKSREQKLLEESLPDLQENLPSFETLRDIYLKSIEGNAQGGRIGLKDGTKKRSGIKKLLSDLEARFPELMTYGSMLAGSGIPFLKDGGRIGAQECGLMDLGGMEKDYREEGGFVPIGGQEKADDVPARLSKNEFVFTADAVRNAGGGDIDEGAAVMERLMENLEAGGKVSEESQGLEGAQEMFANTQRLQNRII